jgi:predicted aldo/keto reductase-like oxidoreductase
MLYRNYGKTGFQVSALGMGCMRLPFGSAGRREVEKEKAFELIRYAADHGINYFDAALTYHHGTCESILGEALAGGYREKVKIATKLMYGFMKTNDDIRRNLESTLKSLRTDYLDVYLLHNIQDSDWDSIKRRKIIEEYVKLRNEGLIKYIGFSYHGGFARFKEMLDYFPWDMCQVQQNLLDIDKGVTEEAIFYAGENGLALVIMEPLRGGGLVVPPPSVQRVYDSGPVRWPAVQWAFRHLLNYPQVSTVLSGMSTMEQLKQNLAIFSAPDATPGCVSAYERAILQKVKTAYESTIAIPCTACEYCIPCPQGIQIPDVFKIYNEGAMYDNFDPSRRWYMLQKRGGSDASNCVQCGQCEAKCPQHIPIIEQLKVAHQALDGWLE